MHAKIFPVQGDGDHYSSSNKGWCSTTALPDTNVHKLFHLGDQVGSEHRSLESLGAIKPAAGMVVDSKKDKTVKACIFQSIPEDVLLQITKKKTVKVAWESMKTW